jgi:hypothetical protein
MEKKILNEVSRIKGMMKQLNENEFTDNDKPNDNMIKDIIEKSKLVVKDGKVDLGWKHDWLKNKKIVKAVSDLKKYEFEVTTTKFNHLITKFTKKYDDGVDTLEIVYDRDIRKSS